MMPRFFKDMPPRKAGKYVAVVIITSPFCEPKEYRTAKASGLRRAYLKARCMAFESDMNLPFADGEIGINWAVRPDTESNHPQIEPVK